MRLTTIRCTNFRNLESVALIPGEGANLITGPNGSGKTSILEAIFYGCTAKSFRGASDDVLLRRGQDVCRLEITGEIQGRETEIEIAWGNNAEATGETAGRSYGKQIKVDGVKLARMADLFDYFHAVSFTPEDTDLIYGAPGVRRKQLDLYLSQGEKSYLTDLLQYNRVMQQRNALLKEFSIDEDEASSLTETLEVWDSQLTTVGARIIEKRLSMIHLTRDKIKRYYQGIEGGTSNLCWKYDPTGLSPNDSAKSVAEIQAYFLQKLKESRRKDLYFGSTSVGPHRDDLLISLNDDAMRQYASQGEAKSAALAIKFTIFDYLTEKLHDTPILLLDEISSDLDQERLIALTKLLPSLGQVFLSTAKPAELLQSTANASIFKMQDGRIVL